MRASHLFFTGLLTLGGSAANAGPEALPIPKSLVVEHEAVHEQLDAAAEEGGEIGAAARELRKQLIPHFEKEERYALPPLALLVPLAKGRVDAEMRPVIEMTNELRAGYDEMLAEHEAIRETAGRLREAAERAGKPQHVEFVDKLALHARNEEEVLYPAAILVGEYLRVQLGTAAARK